jgi:hypothetical protein
MPAGRPSTYDPAFCEQIVDFMKDGFSIGAFAGNIGVCRATIFNWADDYPEFLDAVKRAKAASQLWWERRHQEFAMKGEGNAASIIFGLKNRASDDWQDKQVQEHAGTVGIKRIEHVIVDPAADTGST